MIMYRMPIDLVQYIFWYKENDTRLYLIRFFPISSFLFLPKLLMSFNGSVLSSLPQVSYLSCLNNLQQLSVMNNPCVLMATPCSSNAYPFQSPLILITTITLKDFGGKRFISDIFIIVITVHWYYFSYTCTRRPFFALLKQDTLCFLKIISTTLI